MNHSVQLCARGCFTLKLSLSSKTVTGLESVAAAASPEAEGLFPPSGEIGIVDRSTCSDILYPLAEISGGRRRENGRRDWSRADEDEDGGVNGRLQRCWQAQSL